MNQTFNRRPLRSNSSLDEVDSLRDSLLILGTGVASDWKWDSIANQISIIANDQLLVVQSTWERILLLWVTKGDNGRNPRVQAAANEGSSLADDLCSLTIKQLIL